MTRYVIIRSVTFARCNSQFPIVVSYIGHIPRHFPTYFAASELLLHTTTVLKYILPFYNDYAISYFFKVLQKYRMITVTDLLCSLLTISVCKLSATPFGSLVLKPILSSTSSPAHAMPPTFSSSHPTNIGDGSCYCMP
jgi:hypothetical protein